MLPLLTLLFGIHLALVSGGCQTDQQSLLVELKNTLIFNQSKSTKLVAWNYDADCCEWAGVTCDKGGLGLVIGLNLSKESISGGIDKSDAIFSLQYLQNLDLSFNDFKTSFPVGFANLTGLISLNLSNAGFMGQIPIEISIMTKLVSLDLSMLYYLPGVSSIKLEKPNFATLVHNLTQLRELNLDGVNISANGNEWSQALSSSLPNLQVLSLSNCSLSGPIDPSLAKLQSLSVISMGGNNLSAPVPEFFANFSNLRILLLNDCNLRGTFPPKDFESYLCRLEVNSLNGNIPSSLFVIPSLRKIQLSSNQFTGQVPIISGVSPSLDTLDLSSNKLEGPIPQWVFNISRLNVLLLSSNQFSGTIKLDWIQKLHKLAALDLSYNNLTVDANVTLSSFPQMTTIKLASCNLRVFPDLRNLSNLVSLDLSDNQINGEVPRWIGEVGSSALLSLNLSQNLLVSLPEPLSLPTGLAILDLHNNVLQGNVPLLPPSVVYVDCSNNNFTSSIPPDIEHIQFASPCSTEEQLSWQDWMSKQPWSLAKTQIVDLASNNFGDILPNRALNTWEAMKGNGNENHDHLSFEPLSLSGLYYQDSITVTTKGQQMELVKILTIFTSIDFSDNHFVGPIPDVIGQFSALYTLNLSHNALTGRIPPFLGKLAQLESLDLQLIS
ncbi:hypothetical protein GH714_018161 [Hevea brasiliensis]|uniref:Leucine-rich repeat-containing N-terminal plant-type domain-containing protein n=1 Tax=Hevea brasiliensis TaxID=3981 RepID=A0A6A6M1D6_HEVBR|nr:hypothetical protein GH714_018161 [Hevea brasiliensis]